MPTQIESKIGSYKAKFPHACNFKSIPETRSKRVVHLELLLETYLSLPNSLTILYAQSRQDFIILLTILYSEVTGSNHA